MHTPDVQQRLARYAELVRSHAGRLDLVADGDLERFEQRHVADALKALPLLDAAPDGPCIDVGSGAGLPGVPLAIARPERSWRLLEPRRLRAAFLEECVRRLGLDAEVLLLTAERAAARSDLARAHAFACARALAPPQRSADLLRPLIAPGGLGVVFLGAGTSPPPGSEVVPEGLAIIRPAAGPEERSP
jgi:16S rRNA (guanine527-N7)-methyltransferase